MHLLRRQQDRELGLFKVGGQVIYDRQQRALEAKRALNACLGPWPAVPGTQSDQNGLSDAPHGVSAALYFTGPAQTTLKK